MISDSPSYDRYIGELLWQAGDARALQTRQVRSVPKPVEATVAEPVEVVSERPDPEDEDATLVTYSDGTVWRVWSEFDRGTERVDMRFEQVT